MVRLRNALKDSHGPLSSQYTLIVDSDVLFAPSTTPGAAAGSSRQRRLTDTKSQESGAKNQESGGKRQEARVKREE